MAIAEVQVQSWRETYTGLVPQRFIERRGVGDRFEMWARIFDSGDAGHHLWVGTDSGRVVAFVSAGPARGYEGSGEVYAIYALKSVHGRGIGSRLFRQALGCLKADGFDQVVLKVLDRNPTIEFYKRMGGTIIGPEFEDFEGKPIKEWVMRFRVEEERPGTPSD